MSDNAIEQLIYYLSRLPGIGQRSAKRMALHLIENKNNIMEPLAETLYSAIHTIVECEICGNVDVCSPCHLCLNDSRDQSVICVVENIADLWAFERSNIYRGLYHVLGGNLSALNKKGPQELNIDNLIHRIQNSTIVEIIIATNATMDGQTTAFYITERLSGFNIKISRLAYGMPVGGELDYLDEGTLSAALRLRQPFMEEI